jgi:hypothetical protein
LGTQKGANGSTDAGEVLDFFHQIDLCMLDEGAPREYGHKFRVKKFGWQNANKRIWWPSIKASTTPKPEECIARPRVLKMKARQRKNTN